MNSVRQHNARLMQNYRQEHEEPLASYQATTEPECIALVTRQGLALEHIPLALRTLPVCLAAVNKYDAALSHVPAEYCTTEFLMPILNKNGLAIRYLERSLRTPELVLAAATRSARVHMYLDAAELTPQVRLVIARAYGLCLEEVMSTEPEKELNTRKSAAAIRFLNDEQRTPELVLRLAELDPLILRHLNPAQRTAAVLQRIILKDATLITQLTEQERTDELVLLASLGLKRYRQYIPELPELRERLGKNPAFRNRMIESCGYLIKLVPERLRTTELCTLAADSISEQDRAEYLPELESVSRFSKTKSARHS